MLKNKELEKINNWKEMREELRNNILVYGEDYTDRNHMLQ